MKIAILGWGSLVWDSRDLPHDGPWQPGGPDLPVEFSRLSAGCRLTLVLDPSAPAVPTRFTMSSRSDLREAVEDLRKREGTTLKNVGFYEAATGTHSRSEFPQQVDVTKIVAAWCVDHQVDGCVWTALLPNFQEELGRTFSPDEAMIYLERLGQPARDLALRYIRSAPIEVDTAVRRLVSARWPAIATA